MLKRGVLYYRRRLPGTRSEVAVSLRTRDFREAQHLANLLDRKFLRLAHLSRMPDFQAILRSELIAAIEADRRRHAETPTGRPVYAHWVDEGEDATAADLQRIDANLADARKSLQRRDTIGIDDWVDEVMAKYGLGPELRSALALGLAQVRVQSLEQSRRHVLMGAVPEITLDVPEPTQQAQEVRTEPVAGSRLSEILPPFLEYMSNEGGWRGQTLQQNKGTYRILTEVCGDLPAGAYKRPELAKVLDCLRALPADYGKAKRWRGVPLAEIVAQKDTSARLAVKTLKRHFAALGSLFKYLIERGEYADANPAHGFSFPDKTRPKMKRQMWDGLRLATLFGSPAWTGCKSARSRSRPGALVIKDEKYWLPLLGLYHGNRLEEFAQLIRSDLRQQEGIWYFDINDDEGKQVKNEQSKRRVPIHPKLLSLGLIDYIETVAPGPGDPVFPQLRPGGADGKRGHAFTKWWTRYRKDIGLYEPGLDYHSFRHGVTTKLFAAEVPEVFVDELTGHEGKGTSRAVYTKEMPLQKLYDAICKVEWPEIAL